MKNKIRELVKELPDSSGVYLMKNKDNKIIYVGKAKKLKNRVSQYFINNKKDLKVRKMVENVEEFSYIVTDSEKEALILENNLIKQYKPKYNILLKDDKTYPFIKITNEDFPRIIKVRKVEKDAGKYFGPFESEYLVNEIIETVNRVYKLRTCKRNIEQSIKTNKRPCLNYYIKTCVAPCRNLISKEEYNLIVEDAENFFKLKDKRVLEDLKEKMDLASKNLDYEKAIVFRDRINGIEKMFEKQKIVSAENIKTRDFISIEKIKNSFAIFMFFVRENKVVETREFVFGENFKNSKTFKIESYEDFSKGEILESFVKQYYLSGNFIPREIYLSDEFEDIPILSEFLSEKIKHKVEIKVPKVGDKKDMITLGIKNAMESIKRQLVIREADEIYEKNLEFSLKEILKLEKSVKIRKIESYDISNIKGLDSVAGQVVFVDFKKAPKLYRRYKIKTINGIDDYGSMEEVIQRRIRKGKNNQNDESLKFPDLILLDGGIGHVNVIRNLLERENVKIPVFGMYKDDKHVTKGLCSNLETYPLDTSSDLYKFIAKIQDEVHRFSINYHRSLRGKRSLLSQLDNVKGIGEKRKKELFKHFGSVENIKKASLEEIESVNSMDKKSSENLFLYFKNK